MQIPLRESVDDNTYDSKGHTIKEEDEEGDEELEGKVEETEDFADDDLDWQTSPFDSKRQLTPPSPLQGIEKRTRATTDSAVQKRFRPPNVIIDKRHLTSTNSMDRPGRLSPSCLSPASPPRSPWSSERSTGGLAPTPSQLVETHQVQQASVESATVTRVKPVVMIPLELEDKGDAPPIGFTVAPKAPTFRRQGGSLVYSMGFNILGDWNAEIASLYTKCTDKDAMLLMINVTFGPAAYIMSSSLSECGLLPALAMLSFMAASYNFLSLRVTEVPQLEDKDMETCHDMAHMLLHPILYYLSCFIIVCRAMFLCGSLFHGVEYFAVKLLPGSKETRGQYQQILTWCLLVFLAYTSSFWSSPQSIRINSKLSFYAMVLSFLIIIVCLLWMALAYPMEVVRPLVGPRETWVGALRKATYAFGGVGFLPHIVGDMQRPENCRKVIRKTVLSLYTMYVGIFLTGFIFLGSAGSHKSHRNANLIERIELLHPENTYIKVTCYIVRLCFVIKCLTSYTIILWPLSREFHRIIGMDSAPPLTLSLPWATRRNQQAKLALRFSLVIASTMVFTHGWGYLQQQSVLGREVCAVLIGAPHALVEYFIFPVCVVAAFVRARKRFNKDLNHDKPENEFFGRRRHHFAFTIFVLTCITLIGMFALLAGAARFNRKSE